MNPRVKSVTVLDNYELSLLFDNNEQGIFSMQPYLKYPVFQPLRNYSLFKTARAVMGFVSWNEDIDMSPDTLYLESKKVLRRDVTAL
jgi:Protein of unknown function (DUF2442)